VNTVNDSREAMRDHNVPPDTAYCTALDRRARLTWLVYTETRVRVTHPLQPGATWEGVIIGLADHPTMLLRYDNGRVWPLPQAYAVEVIPGDATGPGGEPAPGTYWERAVLERFAAGGDVDLATVRQQVAALLAETPPSGAPTGAEERES
jgi:hypothetical protein